MHTIIVGAGAAGCVLAARLSESGRERVTLVESGPDYAADRLPSDLADGRHNSFVAHDWKLRHRPNSQQRLRFPFPRGRVVGGSSAVNTCIALRGQPEDYAEWQARGLTDWTPEATSAAFQRIEHDLDFAHAAWHGAAGPLPVRRHPPGELAPWQAAFVAAARASGYPACPDHNEPGRVGVGPHAMNRIDGRRISAALAWLTPDVRARAALTILAETDAVRVAFDGRRAIGLHVRDRDGERLIRGDRVILSAGAVLTPVLLWRSGVGPRDRLEALGAEVVADNPAVAARLLDHPGCAVFFRPLKPGVAHPDHALIQVGLRYTSDDSSVVGDMLLQPGSKVTLPRPTMQIRLCSIMCSVGKPRGTGRLEIRSLKPGALPRIHSALLDHPDDRRRAVDAMHRARDLAATDEMRGLASHLWPSAKVLGNPERTDRWIRSATDSGYHPCGTVPMGSDGDPDAATDGHGRVRGVENLHVVDASLMPTIPSSNIHLPTLMLAERMAVLLGAPLSSDRATPASGEEVASSP